MNQKTIVVENIQPQQPRSKWSQANNYVRKPRGEFGAVIAPGRYIRIFGMYTGNREPIKFDRTFHIGDTVEVGSYNLIYTGAIEKITAKRVFCREYPNDRSLKSFSLCDFIETNWDFDIEEVRRRNSSWYD